MFTKYQSVAYYPDKPLLVWDGDCSFCKYWMIRWKAQTGDHINYEPFQKIAGDIPGLPLDAFREAIRLINSSGNVYDGPHAAYKALSYSGKWSWLLAWYEKDELFRWISDHSYSFVARNRPFMFTLTKIAWGKDPLKPRSYWLVYLIAAIILTALV